MEKLKEAVRGLKASADELLAFCGVPTSPQLIEVNKNEVNNFVPTLKEIEKYQILLDSRFEQTSAWVADPSRTPDDLYEVAILIKNHRITNLTVGLELQAIMLANK